MKTFIENNTGLMLDTLKDLCLIPAPSHHEEKRADYCKKWLEKYGAKGVYIDEALNVIFPLNCDGSNEITVFAAHTDTVFPDMEPMPYYDDGEKIHCPGVSDDTTSIVVLMTMAKYFLENNLMPEKGIMFVCNSCEEGLGNLKGTRQLFRDFNGRIKQFVSFDSVFGYINSRCVGSHRYEVEVKTEGGHSFGKFGNKNAIAELAKIIAEIYKIEVPVKEGVKTTYNVGEISGGTSVNTIAQSAKMLCEYRSDNFECLEYMKNKFENIFKNARNDKVQVNVELVGERPCGTVTYDKIQPLVDIVEPILVEATKMEYICKSASTDCNIPLSLGVPAICIPVNNHAGVHTREEWVEKASIPVGLEIAIRFGRKLLEV